MKPKELAAIRTRTIAEADKGEWESAHADRVALLAYIDQTRLPDQLNCSHAKLTPYISPQGPRFCLKCGKQVSGQRPAHPRGRNEAPLLAGKQPSCSANSEVQR